MYIINNSNKYLYTNQFYLYCCHHLYYGMVLNYFVFKYLMKYRVDEYEFVFMNKKKDTN